MPVAGHEPGDQDVQSTDSAQLTCLLGDVDFTWNVRSFTAKKVEPEEVVAWQFHLYVPSLRSCFLNCWVDGEDVAVFVSSFFHVPEVSV